MSADRFVAADMHLNADPKPGHAVGLHFGWFIVRTAQPIANEPEWWSVTAFGPYPSPAAGKVNAAVTLVSPPRNLVMLPFDPKCDQGALEAMAS